MPRRLIGGRGRRPALIAVALSLALVIGLAALVWHGTTTSFDTWCFDHAYRDFGSATSQRRRFWLLFTEPAVSFTAPGAVVVWAAVTRRWRVAVLAVVAPSLALGITELIGKPLVDRILGPGVLFGDYAGAVHGSFPSGHETGAVSWLALVVVLVLGGLRGWVIRSATVVLAGCWAVAGAVGLTINYYHYATDTIAAVGVSVATVLGVALGIDRCAGLLGRRVSSPAVRNRPRTSRAV